MELSAYELVIIGGGFTIIGGAIGGVTSYYLGIVKIAHDAKRIASIKLREAFAMELATLQRCGIKEAETTDLLKGAFVKHQIAVNDFMLHLSGSELTAFSDAWIKYYGYHKDGVKQDTEFFNKYSHHCDAEGRKKAITNINALLSFANPPVVNSWYSFIKNKIT